MFQQKTKIPQYETVQEFLRDFTFQKKDYILTSRSIYEASFRDSTGGASIVFHGDYGQGEPDDHTLGVILKDMQEEQSERIITISGGSVIGCAKLFALEGTASTEDMSLHRCTSEKSGELIAIPTTCDLGSKASRISIYESTSLHTKPGLAVDALYPNQAVLIPELLSELPFFYFVTSGIDALIHASESLVSPKSSAYTRMFSTEAIRLLLYGFQVIVRGGENTRTRLLGDFMQVSNFTGIIFGNTGMGVVYALGYPLPGTYYVTHGEANYQFFTAVFQTYETREKYSVYDTKKLFSETLSYSMEDVSTCMETLFSTFLTRRPLHEYGMKEGKIKGFVGNVIESQQCLLSNSAIPLPGGGVHSIYKALF